MDGRAVEDYLLMLKRCEVCPRRCGVNRLEGETGYCGVGGQPIIAYYGPHFGEEPPITGTGGSGNIFFSSCNLRCIYCQNHQISHSRVGGIYSIAGLIDIFFRLKEAGCHNINLVTPTPYLPIIAMAIKKAKEAGIGLPFIYNTNAYENVEALSMLDGLIDVYLPDFKYWSPLIAKRLSDAPERAPYPVYARMAIKEMKRQVGDLIIKDGLAVKGLLVRHLVLPGGLSGSRHIIDWIAEELGTNTYLSIMSQYHPLHMANRYPLMNRRLKRKEYYSLIEFLIEKGFENVYIQEMESAGLLIPDFDKKVNPFALKPRI